jgi:hypothetical protein
VVHKFSSAGGAEGRHSGDGCWSARPGRQAREAPRPGGPAVDRGTPGSRPAHPRAVNKITQSVINVGEADYDVRKPNRKSPVSERCLACGRATKRCQLAGLI